MPNNTVPNSDKELQKMIKHMQSVYECREDLNKLQSIWDNLTLLGQLFGTGSDMNNTRLSFQELASSLLKQLSNEVLRKCLLEMTSKAQVAIDILVRNLFERTADIGFLATDHDIVTVAKLAKTPHPDNEKDQLTKHLTQLKARFAEYVSKYSVYSDIVLLNTEGKILLRLNESQQIEQSQHALIKNTLTTSNGYLETFDHLDFLAHEPYSLVYSFRVEDEKKQALAVLCLCFKYENELQGIFSDLVTPDDWSVITLLDNTGKVIASSDIDHIAIGVQLAPVIDQEFSIQRFAGQEYLACTQVSKGYQGYSGPKWFAHVMQPLQHAFNHDVSSALKGIPKNTMDTIMQYSHLFSENLRSIPLQAAQIQQELNRSVWNGNIKQSHSTTGNKAGFSKILLWEISNTGAKTQSVFQNAIDNLNQTVLTSVLEDSRFQASLAIDIMDRNLYERANDCRWWALTTAFKHILSQTEISIEDQTLITNILIYINNLYTVYTNLLVFDTNGTILAISNSNELNLLGENIGSELHQQVLTIPNSQGYAVSAFKKTHLYQNKPTYIYAAAIRDTSEQQVVGGIGIVFDSEPQFSAMLQDTLPKNADGYPDEKSFAVFIDQENHVIACSDNRFSPGDILSISTNLHHLKPNGNLIDIANINGHYYAIGAHASCGYREYKSDIDSYKNHVIALVGKELCPINDADDISEQPPACPSILADRDTNKQSIEIATFRLGKEWFGIRASQVKQATDTALITPTPGAGQECIGYISYEKLPVPVFDIRSVICCAENKLSTSDLKKQQTIIVEYDASTRFGIIVDALGDIPEIAITRMHKLPAMLGGGTLYADTAITPDRPDDEFLLLILNCERLAEKLASGLSLVSMPNSQN